MLGIPPGDVIRLQDNVLKWWNGPDAKRKSSHTDNESNDEHTKKRVRFEKRYRDESGKYSMWGYKLVAGDIDPGADYEWGPVPPVYAYSIGQAWLLSIIRWRGGWAEGENIGDELILNPPLAPIPVT